MFILRKSTKFSIFRKIKHILLWLEDLSFGYYKNRLSSRTEQWVQCRDDRMTKMLFQIRRKDTANPPPGAAVRLNVSDADTTFFSMT